MANIITSSGATTKLGITHAGHCHPHDRIIPFCILLQGRNNPCRHAENDRQQEGGKPNLAETGKLDATRSFTE
ncbi:Uncharacterised protein [Raoultella planticola]|uniref:Uncharacterized protein n=1 Tax=Raoultella planticola TaxID=575 RepID=A0A485AFU6_RAOPL|nr:Uncharacterised protein [Raoultella planticola]